jgi:gamma-butyrobetaine dioxygenase
MDLKACGVKPEVVGAIEAIQPLLQRDGAVVIDGPECGEHASRKLAHEIFAERTLAVPEAARVFEGGEYDHARTQVTNHIATPAHSDGFAYGDLYPDYMMLSCIRECAAGGESVLIDGYEVHQQLLNDRELGWAGKALTETVVDQTEAHMQIALSPIVMNNGQGRTMVRKTLEQKPAPDSTDPERDAQMIKIWLDTINAAFEHAPRFKLLPGQTLVVDNYRLLHGRDAYEDLQRMLWRIWVWTTDSLGVPDLPLASDTRHAIVENT